MKQILWLFGIIVINQIMAVPALLFKPVISMNRLITGWISKNIGKALELVAELDEHPSPDITNPQEIQKKNTQPGSALWTTGTWPMQKNSPLTVTGIRRWPLYQKRCLVCRIVTFTARTAAAFAASAREPCQIRTWPLDRSGRMDA